jgi:chemotaxis protein methyltransferase CheR
MTTMRMKPAQIERIEIDLLMEAIWRRFGYDFRSYAEASIERRIRLFMATSGCSSISEMIPKLLRDPGFFSCLVRQLSVSVTEWFRDPFVYRAVREKVVPLLRTWPHIKIWHAGCASGEEVYSLAIALLEEGLYERATIYATDINTEVLEQARHGIYDIGKLKEATLRHQQSGGCKSFADYYHASYDAAAMNPRLKERIVFATHNLATDNVFGEMHLVFCRNVLIYFKRTLQDRVLGLFTESLVPGGFLCLGTKEDIEFTAARDAFEEVDRNARIFKRRSEP